MQEQEDCARAARFALRCPVITAANQTVRTSGGALERPHGELFHAGFSGGALARIVLKVHPFAPWLKRTLPAR